VNTGLAALPMAAGVWLHLTERHLHEHTHDAMEHEHLNDHDAHHQHAHSPSDPPAASQRFAGSLPFPMTRVIRPA